MLQGQVFQSIGNVTNKSPLPPVGVFWGHLALFLPSRQAAENAVDTAGLRLGHVLWALAQGLHPDLSGTYPAALRGGWEVTLGHSRPGGCRLWAGGVLFICENRSLLRP